MKNTSFELVSYFINIIFYIPIFIYKKLKQIINTEKKKRLFQVILITIGVLAYLGILHLYFTPTDSCIYLNVSLTVLYVILSFILGFIIVCIYEVCFYVYNWIKTGKWNMDV